MASWRAIIAGSGSGSIGKEPLLTPAVCGKQLSLRKGTKEAGNGPSLNKQLFATVDPYAFLTRALRQFLVYCVDQLQILG